MKIKKGDTVLIISGKDRGRTGRVIRVLPKEEGILIEGINLKKKHVRPKRTGEKGQIIEIPSPLDISNIKILCPKCGKAVRVGYKVEAGKKMRVCKKCGQEI
jgi:large subunit ribosomal protein L24